MCAGEAAFVQEGDGGSPDAVPPEATVFGLPVRRLQASATIVLIASVGIAAFFYFQPKHERSREAIRHKECDTEGCRKLRLFLESTVNRSADPCRDFFSFTCAAPLKKERMSQMSDDARAKVMAMVAAADVPDRGQSAFEKAVAMYRACVSLYSQNRSEAEDLRGFLFGLGLNIAEADPSRDPLDAMVQLSLAWNIPAIVSISEVAGSRLDYPHEMTFSEVESDWYQERQGRVINNTYESLVEKHLRFLLPNEDLSSIEAIKENVTRTEAKVVNYLLDEFKAANDQQVSQYLIRVIEVPKYLNNVVTTDQWTSMVERHSENAYRMDDQLVLEPLGGMLTVFLLTELESIDVVRLISWSALRQLVPYADGTTHGGTLDKIRSSCYDDVADVLEAGLTSKYIYKVVTPDVLREAMYMGFHVHQIIKETVAGSSWFSSDAKDVARKKVEALRLIIAFPLNLTRLAALERLYADLPDVALTDTFGINQGARGTGRSFVLSWLNGSRFERRVQIRNPTEIFFPLGTVNAQHTYATDTVNLAGALLEPVIYYHGALAGYNYGGFGQLMGHEIMHGFDVTGRVTDEKGLSKNWWPEEATKKYTEQTLCLRSIHRQALKKRAMALDPKMDSEDLADVMGTRVAFDAFRKLTAAPHSSSSAAQDEGAIGTRVAGFTELQLFFLGHCAKMCDPKVPPRERDQSETYSPNWSRCVVPLMNMPEFGDAFQCKSGSFMNPEHKCKFW
ncbi:neprilysin-1-like isoform X6 [Dermacentor albipictus]|uniref:neprilysin-1-like isoform X6 n=1 Tax=Dermacentor albipictus TaxID=60249 RepID=UPI0031FDFD56